MVTSRRNFIGVGAGTVILSLFACDGAGTGAAAGDTSAAIPSLRPLPAPADSASALSPLRDAPLWSTEFAGSSLQVGESLDLRNHVIHPEGAELRFSLNSESAVIAGILTLTREGMLTRVGPGDVSGVLIDVDDGT